MVLFWNKLCSPVSIFQVYIIFAGILLTCMCVIVKKKLLELHHLLNVSFLSIWEIGSIGGS